MAQTGTMPQFPTPFFGRTQEIQYLHALLWEGDARLVTITGLGGLGKSRTAARVAEVFAEHPNTICAFLQLAPVEAWQRVPELIQEQVTRARYSAPSSILLVLDSFEHVVPAASALAELLAAQPGLRTLVTSRSPLHVQGEHLYPLTPLDSVSATDLFLWHARAVHPGVQLEDRDEIAQLAERLDGIPLAIELAAARCRTLSLAELRMRLPEELHLLTSQRHQDAYHQQTLETAISWTFDLLTDAEQRLARRIAIYPGGARLDAVSHLVPDVTDANLIVMLEHLIDCGMLRSVSQFDGSLRFVMPSTIRAFGLAHLANAHELELTTSRVMSWCRQFAESKPMAIMSSVDSATNRQLDVEMPNIRFALRSCLERGNGVLALQIVNPLWSWFHHRGNIAEGCSWLDRALDATPDVPETRRLRAQAELGKAFLAWAQGDFQTAHTLAAVVEATYRELRRPVGIGFALMCQALVAEERRDFSQARAMLRDAQAQFVLSHHTFFVAQTHMSIGRLALQMGDRNAAEGSYREALVQQRQIGNQWSSIFTMSALGELAMVNDEPGQALTWYQEAWALSLQLDHDWAGAEAMTGIASIAATRGLVHNAARLCGCADIRFQNNQVVPPPTARRVLARTLATLRSHVGSQRVLHHRNQGRLLDASAANELVQRTLETLQTVGNPLNATGRLHLPSAAHLTTREGEVLQYLVQGKSNLEIAEELDIRIATVKVHVTHILQKYELTSRAAVIAAAVGTTDLRGDQPGYDSGSR